MPLIFITNISGRNANHHNVFGNIFDHHAPSTHNRPATYGNSLLDGGPSTNVSPFTDENIPTDCCRGCDMDMAFNPAAMLYNRSGINDGVVSNRRGGIDNATRQQLHALAKKRRG